jgi:hypothetical protein
VDGENTNYIHSTNISNEGKILIVFNCLSSIALLSMKNFEAAA